MTALRGLLVATDPGARRGVDAVMIGTTHFTNAVVERRTSRGSPPSESGCRPARRLPPFVDWPEDLAALVRGEVFMLEGGHEYDGRPIVPFDERGMREAARRIRERGLDLGRDRGVFSPLNAGLRGAGGARSSRRSARRSP